MQAEDFSDAVQMAFGDQHIRTALRHFLSGLEQKFNRERNLVFVAHQNFRRAHQHCRVRVMAAEMSLAGRRRFVRDVILFLNRQRVHIRAQRQRRASLVGVEHRDRAGLRGVADHAHAQPFAEIRAALPRAELLPRHFRVLMQIAADVDEFRVDGAGLIEQRGHEFLP